MKVILIEEPHFKTLLDKLELRLRRETEDFARSNANTVGCTPEVWVSAMTEAHKQLRFAYVDWAQSHGVSFNP